MALTANKDDSRGQVQARSIEGVIADGVVIYDGAMVNWDTNGEMVPARSNVATDKWAGYCIRGGTGDSSADEPPVAVVERVGSRWIPHAAPNASMIGELMYVVDDEIVTDVAPINAYIVGRCTKVDTATNEVLVDFNDRVA